MNYYRENDILLFLKTAPLGDSILQILLFLKLTPLGDGITEFLESFS